MAVTKQPKDSPIGRPMRRVDGPLKVTGRAMYTADHHFPGMLYAVPVGATIGKGTIKKIDTSESERMPGVRGVYQRANFSKLFRVVPTGDFTSHLDERRPAFEDDIIRYFGQYVAVVVAETFEQAKAAADEVKVTYDEQKPNVDRHLEADGKPSVVSERGDAAKAFKDSAVKLDETYIIEPETHNTIELHSTVAVFDGTDFTLYETTQGVSNHKNCLVQMLGVQPNNVRVISKFLGSGFGGKLFPWPHCGLAAGLARELGAPIKLVLSRQQTYHAAGHRPRTQQRVRLGATKTGRLNSIMHEYINDTAMEEDYIENCGECSDYLYKCSNVKVTSALSRRNIGVPTAMRGPGAVPGLFATESAMDELAVKLNIDPVELRKLNEPKKDEGQGIPFASRHLIECMTLGAKRFGWSKRNPRVGSMKKDGLILGWGMACASWIAERFPADAAIELYNDGAIKVVCGTQDIGTGTYTVLAQVAADKLGVPVERVEVVLGDTALPPGPLSGGSMVTGSVIPAVAKATEQAIERLLQAAVDAAGSPFKGMDPNKLVFADGRIGKKGQHGSNVAFDEVVRQSNFKCITGKGHSDSTWGGPSRVSKHSYGAHFVEVTWDEGIARLRVSRVVTVIDAGKIINPKTGRNQIEGAVVMGIGMAMLEATHYEPLHGAPLNSNLADYMVPVNADVPEIEVHFLEFNNQDLNEYGARGIGEIGLAGFAAAVANAVYHATGVRVRDLPIRIEDLLVEI